MLRLDKDIQPSTDHFAMYKSDKGFFLETLRHSPCLVNSTNACRDLKNLLSTWSPDYGDYLSDG